MGLASPVASSWSARWGLAELLPDRLSHNVIFHQLQSLRRLCGFSRPSATPCSELSSFGKGCDPKTWSPISGSSCLCGASLPPIGDSPTPQRRESHRALERTWSPISALFVSLWCFSSPDGLWPPQLAVACSWLTKLNADATVAPPSP